MAMDGPSAEVPEDYSYRNDIVIPQVSMNVLYPDGPQMWEYQGIVHTGDLNKLIERLNKLGAEGWQVCEKLNEVILLIRQIFPEPEETEEEEANRLRRERLMSMSDEEIAEERRQHGERQAETLRSERDRIKRETKQFGWKNPDMFRARSEDGGPSHLPEDNQPG